jgi:hypothetical protein
MALKVDGRFKVKRLKEEFFKEFGVNIRVYKGMRFAQEDLSLASIRSEDAPRGSDFEVSGNMKVGNVEKKFFDTLGIKVQIENATGGLANDDETLAQQRK